MAQFSVNFFAESDTESRSCNIGAAVHLSLVYYLSKENIMQTLYGILTTEINIHLASIIFLESIFSNVNTSPVFFFIWIHVFLFISISKFQLRLDDVSFWAKFLKFYPYLSPKYMFAMPFGSNANFLCSNILYNTIFEICKIKFQPNLSLVMLLATMIIKG